MKTIMVVDDELSIQKQIKDYLGRDEYKIISVKDSRAALNVMDQNETDEYNLILIGSPLPGSESRFGLISMKPDAKMFQYENKDEDFLEKPFTRQQFLDFIQKKI